MSMTPKPESASVMPDDDRVAQALVARGLVTREELQQCRTTIGNNGPSESLLKRLVEARCLTPSQAKRVIQELNLVLAQQIPGYQLLEKIGQGSMGIVFKARQLSMNRLVAIKVLQPRLATNPKDLERFVREAHLVAKLSHNNIVQAIDAGTNGKVYYFVMEYIEGTTIDQYLRGGKIYPEREALELILQIAQALDHASKRGLIHRDIKPGNIILTTEGVAKLADLGLARQAVGDVLAQDERGLVVGTPFYIAPEQVQGREDIDSRADIYSLGATLYHMVTGQPPFPGTEVDPVLDAHLHKELTPPDHINLNLSSGLGEVVEFMMAKDRGRRYASPQDLITDLECLLAGEPPMLARQQIEANVLQELGEGEVEETEEEIALRDEEPAQSESAVWLWVLGIMLALSILVNLILLVRK